MRAAFWPGALGRFAARAVLAARPVISVIRVRTALIAEGIGIPGRRHATTRSVLTWSVITRAAIERTAGWT